MTQLTIQQAFGVAIGHHQAGRLREAERIYRQILAQEPGQADALHLLGVIAHQSGRNEVAVELIGQAIARHPGFAEAQSNLGVALSGLGRFEEAVAAYRQAVALSNRSMRRRITISATRSRIWGGWRRRWRRIGRRLR